MGGEEKKRFCGFDVRLKNFSRLKERNCSYSIFNIKIKSFLNM